jgi:uncharacterized protein involved in exopolysaccharide biosynthesis
VYSEDRREAAQIANAIAESYRDYCGRAQLEQQKAASVRMPAARVQITDLAEPGNVPVRPNKPLNIFLGAVLGIFFATGTGAVITLIAWWLRSRKPALRAA